MYFSTELLSLLLFAGFLVAGFLVAGYFFVLGESELLSELTGLLPGFFAGFSLDELLSFLFAGAFLGGVLSDELLKLLFLAVFGGAFFTDSELLLLSFLFAGFFTPLLVPYFPLLYSYESGLESFYFLTGLDLGLSESEESGEILFFFCTDFTGFFTGSEEEELDFQIAFFFGTSSESLETTFLPVFVGYF